MAYREKFSKPKTLLAKSNGKNGLLISGGGGEIIARGTSSPRHLAKPFSASTRLHKNLTDHLQNSSEFDCISSASVLDEIHDPIRMAGDIRLVDGKKPRKLWTLRDRSAMSVHFLKANLAEDGCEEAQLDVAKKLLQDSKDDHLLEISQKENSRLAIYWLIKSSEQGNEEATKLLKECLTSGRGITEQNIMDVHTCISTPTNEKLMFKAARLLYSKLNNGENFITTTQLRRRINGVSKTSVSSEEQTDSNENSPTNFPNEDSPCNGDIPENIGLNETFTFKNNSDSDVKQCSSENYFQPGEKLTLENLIKVAGEFCSGKNPSPAINNGNKELPRHQWNLGSRFNLFIFQLCFICVLTGSINWRNSVIFLSSFLSLWASFNLMRWKKRYSNFKDWSQAFNSVQYESKRTWTDLEAEYKLTTNLMLGYSSCNLITFGIFCLLDCQNVLKFIVGITVIISQMISLINTPKINLKIVVYLVILNIRQIIPYTVDFIQNSVKDISALDHVSELLVKFCYGNGLEQLLGDGTHFPVEIIQISFLALLLISTTNSQRFIQRNIPELIIAFWLSQVIQNSLILETFDVGISFLLALCLIFTLLAFQSKMEFWRLGIFLGLMLAITSSLIAVSLKVGFLQELSPLRKLHLHFPHANINSGNGLQLSSGSGPIDITKLPIIEWEEYDANCHRHAWKVKSPAATQISCFLKYGSTNPTAVKWNGRISVVKIKDIQLTGGSATEIDQALFEIHVNILTSEGPDTKTWQSYLPGSDNEHSTPATILISTGSIHKKNRNEIMEKILNYRSGDRIEFYGQLNPATVGSLKPEIVNVHSLKCLNCFVNENNVEMSSQIEVKPNYLHETTSDQPKRQEWVIYEKIQQFINDCIAKIKTFTYIEK